MSDTPERMPRIARCSPFYKALEAGESRLWCSCGLSRNQPWCDQSHRGTDFKPVRHVAGEDGEERLFCGCKHTATPPFCDGAHNNLRDADECDDPDSEANRRVRESRPDAQGRAWLDGGCFVASTRHLPAQALGSATLRPVITAETGAHYQSQFALSLPPGQGPVLDWGDRHIVLMVTTGRGELEIGSRRFPLEPEMGAYIRPGEAFRIDNHCSAEMQVYATVCPVAALPETLPTMPDGFQQAFPDRTVATDQGNRQAMGERFFQMLVDKAIGSTVATQFIGEVPLSKALPHRHLYEESLVVLRGRGYMWTETLKAAVATGDVIFLPRKQLHSLQCTDPNGLYLSGIIYPGDNPSINYY